MPIKKNKKIFTDLFKDYKSTIKGQLYPDIKSGLYYNSPEGQLYLQDCNVFLKTLPDESINMIFADPPYNIGKSKIWDG